MSFHTVYNWDRILGWCQHGNPVTSIASLHYFFAALYCSPMHKVCFMPVWYLALLTTLLSGGAPELYWPFNFFLNSQFHDYSSSNISLLIQSWSFGFGVFFSLFVFLSLSQYSICFFYSFYKGAGHFLFIFCFTGITFVSFVLTPKIWWSHQCSSSTWKQILSSKSYTEFLGFHILLASSSLDSSVMCLHS